MSPYRSLSSRQGAWQRARAAVLAIGLLMALLLVAGGLPAGAAQTPGPLAQSPANPPTDRIIVKFRPAADPARLGSADESQLFDQLSATAGVTLRLHRPMSGDAYVLSLPAAVPQSEAAAISARLAALPEVEYAEPDALMQLIASPSLAAGPQANLTPDDSRFDEQWHYRYDPGVEEGLNLLPAWGITTGDAATVVAVIDTGILPHADLAGRALAGYDFIADVPTANDGNGRDPDPADPGDWIAANACFPGSGQRDSSWHGTHVAGTVGAASNNGSDVAGVNWNAMILPVRVLGRCGGWLSDIVDATRWAGGLAVPGVPANPTPADVVNLSLGGSGACGTSYQNAFNELAAAGVVSVVAAGNSNANANNFRPANCNQVITVAATNKTGDRSYYSNYGSVVEISAPGGEQFFWNDPNGVLSTLNDGLTGPANDDAIFYQGTSMASPHVAGLVSLLLGQQPDLTPAEVLTILQDTARDFPAGSSCTPANCGPGIADAFAALSALDAELLPPDLISPADGLTVPTAEPLLEWSLVDGAEAYQVQVATDEAFSDVIIDIVPLSDPSTTVTLPGEGTYYWRARATATPDNGPWSAVWSFTVEFPECATPATPVLLSPADASTTDETTPTFTWEAVADATEYEVVIGEAPGLPEVIQAGHPTEPEYVFPDPLEVGLTYYWMVRAHNLAEGCETSSEWSEPWSVTITEPPPVYTIYLPAVFGE